MMRLLSAPALRMLLQFPGMCLVHLSQGLFGAPSPKPTTLLVLRLQTLESNLHKGMLCSKLMYVETTGKDSKGHFNTAPLKEYPLVYVKPLPLPKVLVQSSVQQALVWITAHDQNCQFRFTISVRKCVITILANLLVWTKRPNSLPAMPQRTRYYGHADIDYTVSVLV